MDSTKNETVNLDEPSLYNNRELSWLDFNYRVLEEALDPRNALLDRYKFLAIFSSNLDEFFMVRVAGLLDQVKAGYNKPENKAGLTPKEQLRAIHQRTHDLVNKQDHAFLQELSPLLEKENVKFLSMEEASKESYAFLENFFDEEVFPVLTPMAIDAYRPFPMLLNKSLNLAVVVEDKSAESKKLFPFDGNLVLVQVPAVINRFIELPRKKRVREFILLEDIITLFIHKLFAGYQVKSVTPFRITRNADLNIHEDEAEDLLQEIEEELKNRKWGAAVRLEIKHGCFDQQVMDYLLAELEIHTDDIYTLRAPLDLTFLFGFYRTIEATHEHLRSQSFIPQPPADLDGDGDIFTKIRQSDVLLHHPYESFEPVIDFVSQAADDKSVLAIKQTLYRVSGDSPIINSLKRAAANGNSGDGSC